MTGEQLMYELINMDPEQRKLPVYLWGDIQDGYADEAVKVLVEEADEDDAGDVIPAHLRLKCW